MADYESGCGIGRIYTRTVCMLLAYGRQKTTVNRAFRLVLLAMFLAAFPN